MLPLDYITAHARTDPDRVAVINNGKAISYAAFRADIASVTAQVGARPNGPNRLLGILMDTDYAEFVALLAAHGAGWATIVMPRDIPERLAQTQARLQCLLTTADGAIAYASFVGGHCSVLPVALTPGASAPCGESQLMACPLAPDDLMHVRMTSGTTGGYKKIPVTRTQFERWADATAELYARRGPTRYLSLTPPHLGLGLIKAVTVWRLGGTVIFDDRDDGFAAIDANRPDEFVATPYFLYRWLKHLDQSRKVPEQHLYLRVDGAKMSRKLHDDLRARVKCSLECGYGSAELGVVAFAGPADASERWLDRFRAAPWARIEVVDRYDQPVPEGTSGLVRCKTRFMPEGYLDDVGLSAQLFRNGWYYSGDRGRLVKGGLLELEGRDGDLLNLSGYKVYCPAVEQDLLSLPGIIDAAAFATLNAGGVEELGIALVISDSDRAEAVASAKARAVESIRIGLERVNFMVIQKIPRNDMGKVMRRLLSTAYRERHRTLKPARDTRGQQDSMALPASEPRAATDPS